MPYITFRQHKLVCCHQVWVMAYILLEISSLIFRLLQDIFEAVKGVMIYAKISTDDSRAMLLMKQLDLGRNSRHNHSKFQGYRGLKNCIQSPWHIRKRIARPIGVPIDKPIRVWLSMYLKGFMMLKNK